LRVALKQPNASPHAWTATLCIVKDNSSNADKHLRNKHADAPETIEYLSPKDAKKEEKKANGLLSTGLLTEFAKSRRFMRQLKLNSSSRFAMFLTQELPHLLVKHTLQDWRKGLMMQVYDVVFLFSQIIALTLYKYFPVCLAGKSKTKGLL